MTEAKWEAVAEAYGELQAEILRGLLEAQGIPVLLSQEGAGRAYGIQVGSLGLVHILVPSEYLATAENVLADCQAGKYELTEGNETGDEDIEAEDDDYGNS